MKKILYSIEKRLELVEFWERSDFQGRFNMFMEADENMRPIPDPKQLDITPIDDDCIICDYCNDGLTVFPAPVIGGSALCQECFKRLNAQPFTGTLN